MLEQIGITLTVLGVIVVLGMVGKRLGWLRFSKWPPAVGVLAPWLRRITNPNTGNRLGGWSGLPFIVLLARLESEHVWEHELVHQRQLWRYGVVGFWIMYLASKDFRQRMEREAG